MLSFPLRQHHLAGGIIGRSQGLSKNTPAIDFVLSCHIKAVHFLTCVFAVQPRGIIYSTDVQVANLQFATAVSSPT